MRGLGDLASTTMAVPVPGPRDVLVRTLAATICTSDLHDLARNPFAIRCHGARARSGGQVVAVRGGRAGSRARHARRRASRRAVRRVLECGRGFGHLCARMGHLGIDRDGRVRGVLHAARRPRRPLADEVPATVGALLEPVAVCLQAIARAGDVRGRDVLVAGDGPFGNIIARLASRDGARRVMVVGREPFRLGLIRGAEAAMAAPRSADGHRHSRGELRRSGVGVPGGAASARAARRLQRAARRPCRSTCSRFTCASWKWSAPATTRSGWTMRCSA